MTGVDVRPAAVLGGAGQVLSGEEVSAFIGEALAGASLDGRSVCVIVPDATRSCPLPLLLDAVYHALIGHVSKLTILVALGTHAEMTDAQLAIHLGGPYEGVTGSTTSGGSLTPSSTSARSPLSGSVRSPAVSSTSQST